MRQTSARIAPELIDGFDVELMRLNSLKSYWTKRGYEFDAQIVSYGFNSNFRNAVLGLKSNTVGGLPPLSKSQFQLTPIAEG